MVQIYVDNIIFGSTDSSMVADFAKLMIYRFQMSMNRELSFFLGLQVKQTNRGFFIHQEKYIPELLKKYSMDTYASTKVLMDFGHKIFANPSGVAVDEKKYRGMIGSLLYLTTNRLDIMFETYLCARFQVNPKMSHLLAMKQIFRYLKVTKGLGIWYPASESFLLQAYSDSNYGGLQLDRKSTLGGCQFLGGGLVSWSFKKQNCIALSTSEAEYITAASCTSQFLWIKSQLLDYGYLF
ncbi:secreted RxLR effector protein 161-like [Lactuca sativa]|uniref:secreted RxLR effector protein 161-like n=1 Tax=Lactuca sativa TaxID=4236 RepID=UPI001C69063F|nr:secreted RxLR effector protein 161-like [Lactuca sativa]